MTCHATHSLFLKLMMTYDNSISPSSPFLIMCRAGHYLCHPVFSILSQCAMYSVSWHFFMSPFMLYLHLFFGRPLLLLETSNLSDFAQMWLGSRLKQWPNHFSILFSRKVSTGFTCASFLMSSFLIWSSQVFPLQVLPISTFSLRLNLVCSHLSSLRPNIQNHMSLLV